HLFAERRRALGAGRAEAAVANERRHDRVAGAEPAHAGPDRLDHARRFVAIDRGKVAAPGAVDIEDVAVADGASGRPDQNLAWAGLRDLDGLDGQPGPESPA